VTGTRYSHLQTRWCKCGSNKWRRISGLPEVPAVVIFQFTSSWLSYKLVFLLLGKIFFLHFRFEGLYRSVQNSNPSLSRHTVYSYQTLCLYLWGIQSRITNFLKSISWYIAYNFGLIWSAVMYTVLKHTV
jgi:hypothetical protein